MKPSHHQNRSGQSLVEFAVVALVLYMLLAAILTFGHLLYVAQCLQSAADLAAREISRTPLPAVTTFETELESGSLDEIYQRDLLVFDLESLAEGESFLADVVPTWPLLNQQLATVMIVERPDINGDGTPDAHLIRYPGALLSDPSTSSGYTVGIPLVESRDSTGTETIRWVPVVEEIESDAAPDPFSIDSDQRGIVALRINYPFQSASMSSFRLNSAGPFEPNIGNANLANDDGVAELNEDERPGGLLGGPMISGQTYAGTYGGEYGLGTQGALGQTVRPYRRVISAQAIYRREVFQ